MKDEALRLALEFVEANHAGGPDAFELINTIKQALEQPEPEILGWATHHDEPMLFPTRKEAVLYCEDDEEPRPLYTSPPKRKPLTDDTLRLDALDQNCWDLRCFSHSHGEEYGWRVIEHHMAKPHERTVAEVYSDDPRKAIDAAIEAAHGIKGEA